MGRSRGTRRASWHGRGRRRRSRWRRRRKKRSERLRLPAAATMASRGSRLEPLERAAGARQRIDGPRLAHRPTGRGCRCRARPACRWPSPGGRRRCIPCRRWPPAVDRGPRGQLADHAGDERVMARFEVQLHVVVLLELFVDVGADAHLLQPCVLGARCPCRDGDSNPSAGRALGWTSDRSRGSRWAGMKGTHPKSCRVAKTRLAEMPMMAASRVRRSSFKIWAPGGIRRQEQAARPLALEGAGPHSRWRSSRSVRPSKSPSVVPEER